MIYRYLFGNKVLTKLRLNLCDRCFFRLVSTQTQNKPTKRVYKKEGRLRDHYFCIKDKRTARIIAKYLTSDLPDNGVIFESCPGTGILTKELLKSGVQSIRVFEENQDYLKSLKTLQNKHPNRLQIINKQILNFRSFFEKYLNEFEFEVKYWFNNIAVRDWRSPPSVRFVAILSSKSSLFLRFIMKILLRKDLFFSYGRTEFFVFISESEYQYMSAEPAINLKTYRSATVLYNTLFDIEILETIPYNSFTAYTASKKELTENEIKRIKGNAKLVRLTPKLYLDEFDERTLHEFYFFVNQTFMKRKNYIIPFLENWFPDCGPDLIRKGIPVFKYFGHLKPEEVLDLFKYFHNRSDYQNSIYKIFAAHEDFEAVDDHLEQIKEDVEDNAEESVVDKKEDNN